VANPGCCAACSKATRKGKWFFTAFLCPACWRKAASQVGLD
jgi:hypothetical protein